MDSTPNSNHTDCNNNYFIMLPIKFIKENKLTSLEEHILGLVISLCKTLGECTMSNNTIADLFGVKRESVSKAITSLVDKSLITREIRNRTSGRTLKAVITNGSKSDNKTFSTGNNSSAISDEENTTASDNENTNLSPTSDEPCSQLVSHRSPNKNNNENNKYIVEIREIIDCLNSKAGTRYRDATKKTQQLISARLNEGFTVDDFKAVIDSKVKDWLHDEKMSKYLRPETLFGSKFESYLNTIAKPPVEKPAEDYYRKYYQEML